MRALNLDRVSKSYKNGKGISDISLSVERGQIAGLLGREGSGKTTVLKILTGLSHADSGDVRIEGRDPWKETEKALKNTGCFVSGPSFYPFLTAKQNLEFVRKFYPKCPQARIGHVLIESGLEESQNIKVKYYSPEMKRLLGLAMVLLPEPDILILDEPSRGFELDRLADFQVLLMEQAARGKTLLIAGETPWELEQICGQVAIIEDGLIVADVCCEEILPEYGSLENYYDSLLKEKKKRA